MFMRNTCRIGILKTKKRMEYLMRSWIRSRSGINQAVIFSKKIKQKARISEKFEFRINNN